MTFASFVWSRLAQSLLALFASSLAISVVFAIIPFCHNVVVLAVVMAMAGLAMGCIDTLSNMQLVKIYQKDSAVFLQVRPKKKLRLYSYFILEFSILYTFILYIYCILNTFIYIPSFLFWAILISLFSLPFEVFIFTVLLRGITLFYSQGNWVSKRSGVFRNYS